MRTRKANIVLEPSGSPRARTDQQQVHDLGDAFAAQAYAAELSGGDSSLSRGSGPALLHLQRRHGNRYVQRLVEIARSRENEVAPGVESAIDRARSGGEALDHGVRSQMEAAFGTDFGAVRVHTGPEAHELNRAVSAVAFTTGSDIFFRDGSYNPSSAGGKELLAHELTHVVQQGRASMDAQRRPVQRMCPACEEEDKKAQLQPKLEVSQPDDAYEREADRTAASVMNILGNSSPAAAVVQEQAKDDALSRLERAVQSASPDALQREVTKQLDDGSITLSATAQLIQGATVLESVNFSKGVQEVAFSKKLQQDPTTPFHGIIRLDIGATWSFTPTPPALLSREGNARLLVDAPFRIATKGDDDAIAKIKQPRLTQQETNGVGAALDPQPQATADADDTGMSVTVSPRVTYLEQNAVQVQVGPNLPLISPPQLQSQAPNTQAFGTSFTVDLTIQKFTPPSPKSYDCKQSFGPFVIGSDQFMKEDDARQGIHDWYFGLDTRVRQDLEGGKGILRATGRASTTGSKTFNLALAEKRAKKVRDIIADFAGSDAHINSFALGEFGAQTADNKEDPNERRVDVEVSGQVPGDQAALMQGDGCSSGLGQTTPTGPTGPVTPPDTTTQTSPAPGSPPPGFTPAPSSPPPDFIPTPSPPPGFVIVPPGPLPSDFATGPSGPQDFTEAASSPGSTEQPVAQTDQSAGAPAPEEEEEVAA